MREQESQRQEEERELRRAQEIAVSREALVRLRCVLFATEHSIPKAAAHFGFHRSTVAKWMKQYVPGDPESLEERSRAPRTVRLPQTDPAVVEHIRALRLTKPEITRAEIHGALATIFGEENTPSESTIGRILRRQHLTQRELLEHGGDHSRADEGASSTSNASSIAAALLIGIGLTFGVPSQVQAAASASFRLYAVPGDVADKSPLASNGFQLQASGMTWRQLPAVGANYQIVSSIVEATDGAGGGTSGGGGTTPDDDDATSGGGRRPRVDVPEETDAPSDDGASTSSAPTEHGDPVVDDAVHPAAPVAPVIRPQVRAPASSASLVRRTLFIPTPAAFSSVEGNECLGNMCPGVAVPSEDSGAAHSAAPEQLNPLSLLIALAILLIQFVWSWLQVARGAYLLRLLPIFFLMHRKEKTTEPVVFTQRDLYSKPRARRSLLARAKQWFAGLSVVLLLLTGSQHWHGAQQAYASAPQRISYNGHLLDADGNAITSAHTIRFSFWDSTDVVAGDIDGAGAINTAAATYEGWQEVHTITPDSNGYFSVELGTVTALPDLTTMNVSTLLSLHLQVEVKASAAANTAYELLDINSSDTAVDRSPVDAVPFALNADTVDQRHVGTGSGTIPYLREDGLLDTAAIPGGTDLSAFVIDFNDTESSEVVLQFGSALSETLSFDIAADRFEFSNDVYIDGNLTLTGLVNGVDISALAGADSTYLRVSSGAGLNLNIAGGSYRLNGAVTNFTGTSSLTIQNDATNYVFFGSGGLSISTIGFPDDESAIPLAEVNTTGGTISSVLDRRVLSTDNSETAIEQYYHASYPNAAYQGDATNNVGQLSVSHDNITLKNFYVWSSSRATIQDYDVILRVALPSGFARWKDNPLTVNYRSTSSSALENKLDISVFDTNGVPVSLSGSTTDLASTSWASTPVEFTGGTWTPGQEFLIKFKLSATDAKQMHLGSIKLQFIEFYQAP